MNETAFDELKRYVRFGAPDEARLVRFASSARKHFDRIVEDFYLRAVEHVGAVQVFTSTEQIERHKSALHEWLASLLAGPWTAEYYERRRRIGWAHVRIGLPQRFMFGAMALIRDALTDIARHECEPSERDELLHALHKLLDIELAIMLESYNEAFLNHVQREERVERDELRRRLALSEARYEEIVETADALICTLDHEGRVLLLNGKSEALSGRSRASAHGSSWLDLFVSKNDHALARKHLGAALSGHSGATYEGPLPSSSPGVALAQRRVRWHFTTLPDGPKPALCAIGIDVSHEHELGIRMRRSERLAALGTMAAGLAHELRNPLNAAHLQLSIAGRRLQRGEADSTTTRAVNAAAGEMERLRALVQDFLQFAQPRTLALERVSLRNLSQACLAELQSEAARGHVALQLLPGDDAVIDADSEKIEQLIRNLVRNAIEAASGGHVEVGVATRGPYAELTVRDNGPGLAADSPVFEPFYTTKEHGTGLGLAIVHRIVMDHGGQVSVQSVPGNTSFSVSLPATNPSDRSGTEPA